MIKRLVLGVLLLTLVTLLVPSLRRRAQPRIDEFREWAGVKLEGPLSPVLNPYRRLKTQTQLARVVNDLVGRRNTGYKPPKPSEFTDYMVGRELSPDGKDAWGSPILMRQEPDSVRLISPGPDLEYQTDDDVVATLRYAAPQRRIRRR